jgi:hypothetical protein
MPRVRMAVRLLIDLTWLSCRPLHPNEYVSQPQSAENDSLEIIRMTKQSWNGVGSCEVP